MLRLPQRFRMWRSRRTTTANVDEDGRRSRPQPVAVLAERRAESAGPECERLNLLPAKRTNGLQAKGVYSSWGGSVVFDASAKVYHMFAALMAHGCGLNEWRPSSTGPGRGGRTHWSVLSSRTLRTRRRWSSTRPTARGWSTAWAPG